MGYISAIQPLARRMSRATTISKIVALIAQIRFLPSLHVIASHLCLG